MLSAKKEPRVFKVSEALSSCTEQALRGNRIFFTETVSAGCKLASGRILTVRIRRGRRGEIRGLAKA
jgi:hypothetical protein